MPKYLAITIGPVSPTIAKARNTRSLWAGSYLFSHLMRKLIQAIGDHRDYIMPLVADERLFAPYGGAGLFPDRFIVKLQDDEDGAAVLQNAADAVLTEFCGHPEINSIFAKTAGFSSPKLKQFLTQYLSLAGVELELSDGENIIKRCSDSLSQLELQTPLLPDETTDWLAIFLSKANKSHFIQEAFVLGLENRFPSLIEISTSEFIHYSPKYEAVKQLWLNETKQDEETETDLDLLDYLQRPNNHNEDWLTFRQYHKYIAIVKADGDNMGITLSWLYKHHPHLVPQLGKALLDFNIEAIKLIRNFGGRAVYLGGDDILFLAPVHYVDETIFGLVERLSTVYNTCMRSLVATLSEAEQVAVSLPTLSFGLSISYHKYPLFETLEVASSMEKKAKKGSKNSIAFQLLKNSGQYVEAVVRKQTTTYIKHFQPLVANPLLTDETFLTSVLHGLRQNRSLLELALTDDEQGQQANPPSYRDALSNTFDNTYNEGIHNQQRPFINDLKNLLRQAFADTDTDIPLTVRFDSTFALAFATLRFLKFLLQPLADTDDED